MNKREFLEELSKQLSYSMDKCTIINNILEENFFISKKNKEVIIKELMNELNINYDESLEIYNIATKIINNEIKNKLIHPFKSKD